MVHVMMYYLWTRTSSKHAAYIFAIACILLSGAAKDLSEIKVKTLDEIKKEKQQKLQAEKAAKQQLQNGEETASCSTRSAPGKNGGRLNECETHLYGRHALSSLRISVKPQNVLHAHNACLI